MPNRPRATHWPPLGCAQSYRTTPTHPQLRGCATCGAATCPHGTCGLACKLSGMLWGVWMGSVKPALTMAVLRSTCLTWWASRAAKKANPASGAEPMLVKSGRACKPWRLRPLTPGPNYVASIKPKYATPAPPNSNQPPRVVAPSAISIKPMSTLAISRLIKKLNFESIGNSAQWLTQQVAHQKQRPDNSQARRTRALRCAPQQVPRHCAKAHQGQQAKNILKPNHHEASVAHHG